MKSAFPYFRLALLSLAFISFFCMSSPVWAEPDAPEPEKEAPSAEETLKEEIPRIDSDLTLPVLIKKVDPSYPDLAQAEGIAAEVVLDIDIDAEGLVENVFIVQPADPPGYGFDDSAIVAALQLEFQPARLGDQPVPVRISYRFRFVPDVTPPQPAETPPPPPVGQMEGMLRERGTRLPLAGVKVTVFRGEGEEAEGFETETDEEGRFRFEGLGEGKWKVLADPEGYYPSRTTEMVYENSVTKIAYSIEKRSYNPYDLLVETKRIRREVNYTTMEAKQAERIPGTFGDVLAVVQNFPGVARTNGSVVVRGAAPEDSRVFVDSVQVPILYHFGELRGVLPVGMIERVDFFPGNFSVAYGRATGGIIDVDLKDLSPLKVGGYADISILDTSLYLEAPVGEDFSIAIGGRRSYVDLLLAAVIPDTGDSITFPRYYDFQILASYDPSPAHHVETFFFLSDDKFAVLFEEPVEADAKLVVTDFRFATNFYRATAKYRYVPNERFENELKISYGQDHFDLSLGNFLFLDILLNQGQIRDTARYEFFDSLAIRAGIDYLFQDVDYSIRAPMLPQEGETENRLDSDDFIYSEMIDKFHSSAGFLEFEIQPIEGMLWVPGVRYDHFTRTGRSSVAPRFSVRQRLGEQWIVKGGVGLFYQEPTPPETDPQFGNSELGLERAVHYSAGFEYRPVPHISLDITGFYKTLHNLVSGTDEITLRDGTQVPTRLNNGGEGRVIGAEISARHELADGIFAWLAYTLSRAERKDYGDDGYRLFDHDQTHILTLVGSYQLPRNWEISARYRFVTGNLYTPFVGAIYNADFDDYDGIPGETNSARVSAFHQLDFRIDKKWVYENWMLNAYLDIQNVTNQTNSNGRQYNYDYSESQETQESLPILPVFGIRGEF